MANTKKVVEKTFITNDELDKYKELTSIAAKVRYLLSLNKSRGDISRFMSKQEGKYIRYQWVRNIALQPLKKVAE